MSDASVIEAVRTELARLGQAANVQAHERNGVVTLTGRVADSNLRRIVGQEILRLPQVLGLNNELVVPPHAGDLRHRLLEQLQLQGVDTRGMSVTVENGTVRLSGDAPGWFDRDAAQRLAWALPGVRKVINDIRIPPDAADPEVADQRP